jgi:hypothetical protein
MHAADHPVAKEAMIARGVIAVMNNGQPVQRAGDPSRSER